jgi:peptidoglycan hydrolase CwlO-like protein
MKKGMKNVFMLMFMLVLVLGLSGFAQAACDVTAVTMTNPVSGSFVGDSETVTWVKDNPLELSDTCAFILDIDQNDGDWHQIGSTDPGEMTFDWNTSLCNAGFCTDNNNYRIRVRTGSTELGQAGDFTLDNTAPTVLSITTNDVDENGQIDQLIVVFDETMNNAGTDAGWSVAGYAVSGNAGWSTTTSTDDTLTLTLTESGAGDTDATPDTTYTAGDLVDLAGNPLADVLTGDIAEVDGAAPIGTLSVDTDPVYESDLIQVVTVLYSEPMEPTSTPTLGFSGNVGAITTQADGAWTAPDTWTETFDVADANEETTVTVSSSLATDLIPIVEGTSIDTNFDIDTLQPTVLSLDDVDFLFVDRGNIVTVTATFSENMTKSVLPTVVESGADAPGWIIGVPIWATPTTLEFNYAVPDADVGLLADTSFTISLAQDLAGNVMAGHIESTTIDTDQPTGTLSVDTDPVYESDLVQVVTVTYDEAMDPTSTPTVGFSGNAVAPTSSADGAWSAGNTVWAESFTFSDENEEVTVTVSSSLATDASGNVETTSITTTFEVDTKEPTGTLSVDTDPVYESDLVQVVTVTYDEMMDSASTPTIGFTGNVGAITTQADGAWSVGDTVWTETFDVADANEETTVTVSSADATDVVGNVEGASVDATFDVDTLQPTVINATAVPDPAKDGVVTLTVTFSEIMDVLVSPTVVVTGLISSPYSVTETSYVGDTWVGTFTLLDDDEETTATIDVSLGQDVAGNVMVTDATNTFEVDTIVPWTESVEMSPTEDFRSGTEVLFMATLRDGAGVQSGELKIWSNGVEVDSASVIFADGTPGGTVEEVSVLHTVTLSDDVYEWTIVATDTAGNVKTTVDVADNFRVDAAAAEYYSAAVIDAKITILETSIDANTLAIVTLQTQVDLLSVDVVANAAAITALQADIVDLQAQITANDAEILTLQGLVDVLRTDVDTNTADIAALDARLTTLEATVATMQTDLTALDARLTALELRVDVVEGRVTVLEADVVANTALITGLQTQVDLLSVDVVANAAAITALQADIVDLQAQITANDAEILTLQGLVDVLRTDVDTNTADIAALDARLTTLEGTVATLQSDVTTLTNDFNTLKAKVDAFLAFTVTDTTDELFESPNTVTVTGNTSEVATCELYDQFGALWMGPSIAGTEHSFVIASPEAGTTPFELRCSTTDYTKSAYSAYDYLISYAINEPDTERGFGYVGATRNPYPFWMSTNALNAANLTDTSVENVLFGGLSTLNESNVEVLWSYSPSTDSWDSYMPGNVTNTFTEFTAALGYYELEYFTSGFGRYIRHAKVS